MACLCRREQRKQIISAVTSRAGVMPFPIQFLIIMLFLLISHFPTLSFSCYSFRICKPSRLWVCFLLPPAYDSLCVTRSRHPQCVSLVLTLCYLFTRLEAGLIWWKLPVQIPNQATSTYCSICGCSWCELLEMSFCLWQLKLAFLGLCLVGGCSFELFEFSSSRICM
jgi:hypothetical protein